jgi:hypothetical protein
VTSARRLSGPLIASETLSGLIHVTGTLTIRNEPTIRILPGTKFIVAIDSEIEFGGQGTRPTIIAEGTPEAPILFCGEAGTRGYWSRLIVRENVKPESVLRNVLVADAGGVASEGALEVDAPITLQGIQVRNANQAGVRASIFGANSHTLIVKGSARSATLNSISAVDTFPTLADLTGNTVDEILLNYASFSRGARFRNLGVSYRQQGDSNAAGTVSGSEIISFDAGIRYEVEGRKQLNWGSATVKAQGTATQPITFASLNSGGYLGSRIVMNPTVEGTSFTHTVFDGFGYYSPGQTPQAWPGVEISGQLVTFDNVTVNGFWRSLQIGSSYGVAGGFTPQSRAITLQVGGSFGLPTAIYFTNADAALTLPADTVLPTYPPIAVAGGTISRSGTLRRFSTAYAFEFGMGVASGATLVVEPGVHMTFDHQDTLNFYPGSGGTLVGTAAQPIVLEGSWGGVIVDTSGIRLEYVTVSGGGNQPSGSPAANIVARQPIVLLNSSIEGSRGWGLLKSASDTTAYAATNTFAGNALGNIGTLP